MHCYNISTEVVDCHSKHPLNLILNLIKTNDKLNLNPYYKLFTWMT
jgi:hypothetical protein